MSNENFEFNIDDILAEFYADEKAASAAEPQSRRDAEFGVRSSEFVEPKSRRTAEPQRAVSSEQRAVSREKLRAQSSELRADEAAGIKLKAQSSKLKAAKARPAAALLNGVLCLLLAACLVWGLTNINPYPVSQIQAIATPLPTTAPAEEMPGTDETTEEPVPSEQPEAETEKSFIPVPNPGFGNVSTADAAKVNEIIQQARDAGLLKEDETTAFSPDVTFNTPERSYYQDIKYYIDDSILAIAWKELIDGYTLTMCEIKIRDGSQIHMDVWGDVNNENDNNYLLQIVQDMNVVCAMNTDKCKARGDGVLVWNSQLYKYNENPYAGSLLRYNCLDNCYVTGDGDLLFTYRLEEMTTEQMQQYIADNNIMFSISFGPALIADGQLRTGYNPGDENYIEYAFGETEKPYSRCGFGQIDERHYLYVSLNHSDEQDARWTMREFAEHLHAKGYLKSFYGLDGGQTAELVIDNTIYNHIDFGAERLTSNYMYFTSGVTGG